MNGNGNENGNDQHRIAALVDIYQSISISNSRNSADLWIDFTVLFNFCQSMYIV